VSLCRHRRRRRHHHYHHHAVCSHSFDDIRPITLSSSVPRYLHCLTIPVTFLSHSYIALYLIDWLIDW
jgi:hypothetical protein